MLQVQEQYYSNCFYDSDSPLSVYKLCYPEKSSKEIEKIVNKYRRKLYSRYINGNTFNMLTEDMLKLAIKKSGHNSQQLEILIIYNIEADFREEIAEMYTLTMEYLDMYSITGIQNLRQEFEKIENKFGKRNNKQLELR